MPTERRASLTSDNDSLEQTGSKNSNVRPAKEAKTIAAKRERAADEAEIEGTCDGATVGHDACTIPESKRAKREVKSKSRKPEPQPTKGDGDITAAYAKPKSSAETAPDQLKVVTWNVNGLRSVLGPSPYYGGKSPLLEYVREEQPDVIFLNEVKLNDKIKDDYGDILHGYKGKVNIAEKNGYAGVAVFWRVDIVKPCGVHFGIDQPEHDKDGRTVTLELTDLVLVGTYVPNSGRGLVKLDYRVNDYDPAMREWLTKRSKTQIEGETKHKDLIWCGDLNVAHKEIDIWNSKGNQKSAGHTPEERKSFSKLLQENNGYFKDVYREMYPDKVEYTYWAATSPTGYLENKGWRLDYFVATEDASKRCKDVIIRKDIRGSDHCPVVLIISKGKSTV